MKKIYFDHNATTPTRPEVVEAMLPYLSDEWGNASSIHWAGRAPKKALEDAREKICELVNCSPVEMVFTSSGTESDNLAIKGTALSKKKKGNHIITTKVEHPAVLNTCKYLEREGFEVTYLGVDADGMIDLDELSDAITDKTILITVMYANNETGVILPVEDIGAIARKRGVTFHTDAVQAAGKVPIDVKKINCDLLSISAHKFYGPKGVGALYLRRGARVVPLMHGGHHERNRRGGTENIPAIVGFAKAAELAMAEMDSESRRLAALRDKLEESLIERVPHVKLNGNKEKRIPNTTNVSFEFIEGESLLLNLDMLGVAASSGSACTSGSLEASHVLVAMGLAPELYHGSVRFSLGKSSTEEDVDFIIEKMPPIVERTRAMSPLWNEAEGKGMEIEFSEKSCSR